MSNSPRTQDTIARGVAHFGLNVRHVLVCFQNGTDLEGYIRADADVDDIFDLVEDGTGERFKCNGWNASVEEM